MLKKYTLVMLAAWLIVYIAGGVYFANRFKPDTYINGIRVDGMTMDEATEKVFQLLPNSSIDILLKDGRSESITLNQIGLSSDADRKMASVLGSGFRWNWPECFFIKRECTVKQDLLFDESSLKDVVDSLECVSGTGITQPRDAEIRKAEDGTFEIEAEIEGNAIDAGRLCAAVSHAIQSNCPYVDVKAEGCYMQPSVLKSDESLKKKLEKAKQIEQETITIDLKGVEETIGWETFGDWVTYKKGKFRANRDKAAAYVDGLAEKYDTYGKKRKFLSSGGETIQVGGGDWDNYGFELNRDGTTKALRKAITGGADSEIDAVWEREGSMHTTDHADFGNTYIEISIPSQHMWFYKDGKLMTETDVVTGTPTEKRKTPTGAFCVQCKLIDHTMTGSYGSAFCKRFMLITGNGVGIHDASWRGQYGGDIYTYDGSHGCINTPFEKVSVIFDNVEDGTPVVVY